MNKLIGVVGQISSGKDAITNFIIDDVYKGEGYQNKKFAEKLKALIAGLLGVDREKLEDREFKDKHIKEFDILLVVFKDTNNAYVSRVFMAELATNDEYIYNSLRGKTLEIVNKKRIEMTPRLMMQKIGSMLFRDAYAPDFWVQALFSEYDENSKWVISDARYPNDEIITIKNKGGIVIGVRRFFHLRYPQYSDLVDYENPYEIPKALLGINPELYGVLTFESENVMNDLRACDFIVDNNGTLDDLYCKVNEILKK